VYIYIYISNYNMQDESIMHARWTGEGTGAFHMTAFSCLLLVETKARYDKHEHATLCSHLAQNQH